MFITIIIKVFIFLTIIFTSFKTRIVDIIILQIHNKNKSVFVGTKEKLNKTRK